MKHFVAMFISLLIFSPEAFSRSFQDHIRDLHKEIEVFNGYVAEQTRIENNFFNNIQFFSMDQFPPEKKNSRYKGLCYVNFSTTVKPQYFALAIGYETPKKRKRYSREYDEASQPRDLKPAIRLLNMTYGYRLDSLDEINERFRKGLMDSLDPNPNVVTRFIKDGADTSTLLYQMEAPRRSTGTYNFHKYNFLIRSMDEDNETLVMVAADKENGTIEGSCEFHRVHL